jgi:hypothetical protein
VFHIFSNPIHKTFKMSLKLVSHSKPESIAPNNSALGKRFYSSEPLHLIAEQAWQHGMMVPKVHSGTLTQGISQLFGNKGTLRACKAYTSMNVLASPNPTDCRTKRYKKGESSEWLTLRYDSTK